MKQELPNAEFIIWKCLSGSQAQGLATKTSDRDLKGVFVAPRHQYFGLECPQQLGDPSNDEVYYELGRFIELLTKSNPNALELLFSPQSAILQAHKGFSKLFKIATLSKQCKNTFGGYAQTQIKKAKGLNKKIVNPLPRARKGILDFCFVAVGQGSVQLKQFIATHQLDINLCGLSRISHMHEVYGLYYGEEFKGIATENAQDVSLSSIPKGLAPIAYMSFNKSGYSKYCKEYQSYWEWVEKRNQLRYQATLGHGKQYDAKNMMHTFRLLIMCEEIGRSGVLHVDQSENREFLLKIKEGGFEYKQLLEMASKRLQSIEVVYQQSYLPDQPDYEALNQFLVSFRAEFYSKL